MRSAYSGFQGLGFRAGGKSIRTGVSVAAIGSRVKASLGYGPGYAGLVCLASWQGISFSVAQASSGKLQNDSHRQQPRTYSSACSNPASSIDFGDP